MMRNATVLLCLLTGCAGMESIDVNGTERDFIVRAPESYEPNQLPVVLVLHGGGGNARSMMRYSDFGDLAEKEGVLVVFPNGADRGWNDGRVDKNVRREGDDVEFLGALLDHLEAIYDIDESRVFVTGISNGGFMSIRAACDMPERITAIAPVAASMSEEVFAYCQPTVSALFVHGTEDEWVPYEGGPVMDEDAERGSAVGVPATVERWVDSNRCTSSPVELPSIDEEDDGTIVKRRRYEECANRVKLEVVEIEGGGHTWPGKSSIVDFAIGTSTDEIDGTELIWDWFTTAN